VQNGTEWTLKASEEFTDDEARC